MRMIPRYLTATALACLLLAGCGGTGSDGPDVDLGDSAGGPSKESGLSPTGYLDQAVSYATKCEQSLDEQSCSSIFSSLERGFAGAQRDPSRGFADKWREVSRDLDGIYSKEAIACKAIKPDANEEERKRCDVALSVMQYVSEEDRKVKETFARIPRSDSLVDSKVEVEVEGKTMKVVEGAKEIAGKASAKARTVVDRIKSGKWGLPFKK
ncbi:hypothetical protein [Streptomyces albidoflavus]|uniref:hypothetical protein n=1 Tax=Streptomyces albidoflavus TaxID=1886 RepID=UPI001021ADE7|nr:hypothetical protein [Streptomyces albidoflavus]RZD79608.1 hypothetical protein C0Q61_14250 [Streptomyces albidoflavus]